MREALLDRRWGNSLGNSVSEARSQQAGGADPVNIGRCSMPTTLVPRFGLDWLVTSCYEKGLANLYAF